MPMESMVPHSRLPLRILTYASYLQFSFWHPSRQLRHMFALKVALKSSGRMLENSYLPVQ